MLGEERGPVTDELLVGICKRGLGGASFKKFYETHSTHRARKVIPHVAHCILGEGAARRLNAAVQIRLIDDWRKISERFWKIEPEAAKAIVSDVVGLEEIKVLTSSEADALESAAFNKLLDRIAGV